MSVLSEEIRPCQNSLERYFGESVENKVGLLNSISRDYENKVNRAESDEEPCHVARKFQYLPLGPNHAKAKWLKFVDWLKRRSEYREKQPFVFEWIWSNPSDRFTSHRKRHSSRQDSRGNSSRSRSFSPSCCSEEKARIQKSSRDCKRRLSRKHDHSLLSRSSISTSSALAEKDSRKASSSYEESSVSSESLSSGKRRRKHQGHKSRYREKGKHNKRSRKHERKSKEKKKKHKKKRRKISESVSCSSSSSSPSSSNKSPASPVEKRKEETTLEKDIPNQGSLADNLENSNNHVSRISLDNQDIGDLEHIRQDESKESQQSTNGVEDTLRKQIDELSDTSGESIGPSPLEASQKLSRQLMNYGGALRPGEGEAMAQYVQARRRIPRRGEVGLTADEIEKFEDLGYVMSGSRHRRMNAVRIRKENQVYSAEEQRALAMYSYEERATRESQLIDDLKEMLKQQNERFLQESGETVDPSF